MHQIALLLFFSFFFPGEHANESPRSSVKRHPYRATYPLSLVNQLIFIKTLKNADQIYTYLKKLKLNTCIGLIAIIVKLLFTVTINKLFPLV